ncbi:reverse transcriptase domain-containing protein [Tanacetum coccineum]
MSGCGIDQKVKYTAGSFVGKALTWWNSQIRTLSREVVVSMSWNDFKFMMIQEFCPSHEVQKLESELWNRAMVGAGHAAYTDRFHELARLVPHSVTLESRMIKRLVIGGLDVASNQGTRSIAWRIIKMERPGMVDEERPRCMRTRSSSHLIAESSTTLKRRNHRRSKQRVESFSLEETPIVTMADERTMAELLCAPTEGYAKAIVVPPIPTEHFDLKHSLINLVTSKLFFGFEKEDPHAHTRYFNKITSTLKYKDVPETSIKLMLFPFSIDGPARIWLDKEPSRSILTWDDLVSKFINHFFPPSKTKNLRNEISNFQQKFEETFSNVDSSEIASAVACVVTSAVTAMFKQHQVTPAPASVKAVEESCVTCGGAHSYRQCPATVGNTFSRYQDNIQGYVSAAAVNYNQGNTGYCPQSVANQF